MGLYRGPLVCSLFCWLCKFIGSAGEYVGSVSGKGSGDFVPIIMKSIVDFFYWSCLYQEESIPMVADS